MNCRWGRLVVGVAGGCLVPAISCGGEVATTPTVIIGGISSVETPTPVSVGATTSGGAVTITIVDVLAGSNGDSSCAVLAAMNVSDIKNAFEITLTFPASTPPGTYKFSDVGAVASILITDQNCANAYASATNDGELWLTRNDTEVDGSFKATFGVGSATGEVLAQNLAAPMCSSPPVVSNGSCASLGYCTTSASLSCWELPH